MMHTILLPILVHVDSVIESLHAFLNEVCHVVPLAQWHNVAHFVQKKIIATIELPYFAIFNSSFATIFPSFTITLSVALAHIPFE